MGKFLYDHRKTRRRIAPRSRLLNIGLTYILVAVTYIAGLWGSDSAWFSSSFDAI
jgi:hypothetical protein